MDLEKWHKLDVWDVKNDLLSFCKKAHSDGSDWPPTILCCTNHTFNCLKVQHLPATYNHALNYFVPIKIKHIKIFVQQNKAFLGKNN